MDLNCQKFGSQSARDTLFIHCSLGSSRWWQPTVDAWNRTGSLGGRTLYCVDQRGSGDNPDHLATDHARFTLDDLAHDMLELVEREGMDRPALVGHSLGGLIAARMLMLAPGRFDSAVLLAPIGPTGRVADANMHDAYRIIAKSREIAESVIMDTIDRNGDLDPGYRSRLGADAHKAARNLGTNLLDILGTINLTADAAKVTEPVLVLHGEDDQVIPRASAELWARHLPNAKFESVPGVGHCWHLEDAPAFTSRLRDWSARA